MASCSSRLPKKTGTTLGTLLPIIRVNLNRESHLMTDAASWYKGIGQEFASHGTVEHSADEYVRREGERVIHTNTVEGYYSIFKRGMRGVYQHCKEKHLHRYLAEFDFRYNTRTALGYNDFIRAERASSASALPIDGLTSKVRPKRIKRGLPARVLCCGGLFATTSTARSKRAHASGNNSSSLD
jgi:ISXO2-like transposase domain